LGLPAFKQQFQFILVKIYAPALVTAVNHDPAQLGLFHSTTAFGTTHPVLLFKGRGPLLGPLGVQDLPLPFDDFLIRFVKKFAFFIQFCFQKFFFGPFSLPGPCSFRHPDHAPPPLSIRCKSGH